MSKKPRALDKSELQAFLSHLSPRNRDLAILILNTGLRAGEFTQLTKNCERCRVFIVPASITKTKQEREIPLNRAAYSAYQNTIYRQENSKTRHKFLCPVGIRKLQKIFKAAGEQANLVKKTTPHILRHTFATNLVTLGINTRIIQELLGHKCLASTQIYTGVSLDSMKAAVMRLSVS